MQKEPQPLVQFEITEQTRDTVAAWIAAAHLTSGQFLFSSRVAASMWVLVGSAISFYWVFTRTADTAPSYPAGTMDHPCRT